MNTTTETPRTDAENKKTQASVFMNSPLQISLILHIYCRADAIENEYAPAVQEELRIFQRRGMIKSQVDLPGYQLTPRGRAFVSLLLSTPIPAVVFINPITQEIIK